MSPERFIDYSTHVSADVFSIGIMLFELLFGHLPYDFKSDRPVIAQIVEHDYFRMAEYFLRREFNDKVSSVVLKCLHPDMSKRYDNYKKLVVDINNC